MSDTTTPKIQAPLTLADALYKIYVEGINPGLTLEQAQELHRSIQEQYKDVIAKSKAQSTTWNGVRDNSK
jgi:hypothetical protein